ncbi:MAG: hypothetical protein ILP19_09790 [Oscillospiraceae bacterium]|nr:hypothetical protein [Oscillospiraceae bacterium]
MKTGFEDAFTDIQSGMVSLCLEYAGEDTDRIFIYAYQTEGVRMFNAFFDKGGQIAAAGQIASDELSDEFMAAGREDIKKITDICAEYDHKAPNEMRLTYDVNTHKFDAQYGYENYSLKNKTTPMTEFLNWYRKEKTNK